VSKPTVLIQRNDVRLVVMAASAFNDGMAPRLDRSTEARQELTEAIQRLAALVDLEYHGAR
jgi:hypothetical protein